MPDVNVRRSQAILRMPIDYVDATLMLHDGERSEVIFLVPRGETVARLIAEGDAFVPVMRHAKICLVARAAIACVGLPAKRPVCAAEDDLPTQHQHAIIKLRGGTVIEGEVRWTAPASSLADHLNGNDSPHVFAETAGTTFVVVKAHITTAEEK
jgi:hypothetical protein